MRKSFARMSAVCLAAGLLLGNSTAVFAEDTASGDEAVKDVAGTLGFAECDEASYVNVRSEASTDSGEVIGVLKNHDSAEIESVEDDGWYKIKSGDVEGYVAAWLIKTGEEADRIASEVAYNYVVNNAVSLNVRTQADEESDVVTALDEGAEAEVVAEDGNWFKVALDPDTYGYVSKDYVEEKTAYPTGETIDQMLSEAEAESREDEQAAQTETQQTEAVQTETPQTDTPQEETLQTNAPQTEAAETQTPQTEAAETETPQTDTPQTETQQTDTPQTEAPQTEAPQTEAPQTEAPQTEAAASQTGAAVVAYAAQFVGNPYVWGGTSLTNGADCSGFTQSVFAHFGVSLPHDAASQLYCGTQVSIDSLAPGDLVFFSSGSGIDHVAIYAGNGSIVHAANSQAGICWGSLNWMTPVAACRVI